MQNIEAILKASGKLLGGKELKELAKEIAFYVQHTKDYAPLVIGGGPYYDSLCKSHERYFGVTDKVRNLRITSPTLMYGSKEHELKGLRDIALENQEEVVLALKSAGVNAKAVPFNYLRAKAAGILDGVDMGHTGYAIDVDKRIITEYSKKEIVPVFSHIGVDDKGVEYNTNATETATVSGKIFNANKIILLGNLPIMRDINDSKSKIDLITLDELAELEALGIINDGMKLNVSLSSDFLRYTGIGHSVHMTKLCYDKDERHDHTGLYHEIKGNPHGTIITL